MLSIGHSRTNTVYVIKYEFGYFRSFHILLKDPNWSGYGRYRLLVIIVSHVVGYHNKSLQCEKGKTVMFQVARYCELA